MNITIANNSVALVNNGGTGGAFQGATTGIDVRAGSNNGDTATTVAYIHNNSVTSSPTPINNNDTIALLLREGSNTSHLQLQNLSGSGSNNSIAVATWNGNSNTPSGSAVAVDAVGAPLYTSGTALTPSNPSAMFSAAGGVASASNTVGEMQLSQAQLDSAVAAALAIWAAQGLSASQLAELRHVTYDVADITGGWLGQSTPGHVTIDVNADGHGWFVDATPSDNLEFANATSAHDFTADPTAAPAGHMDLLTTVMHEMGEQLGLEDLMAPTDHGGLMYAFLATGERVLPDAADVARIPATTTFDQITMAENALPQSAQAAPGTQVLVGTAASDTIDAGHGGNILFGGAGADKFVFGPATPLDAPTPAQITHVADYHAAEGDSFDFSAITSQFHNSSVSDAMVVRAVEDASGRFATLQVDHFGAAGLLSAPNWVNVAQIDGAHAGDTVNVLIDSHSVHLAQIHVDLLV